MSTVYTSTGSEKGQRFASTEAAEQWLTENGYQRRPTQPRQWVLLLPAGNQFASVVADSTEPFKRNLGKQGEPVVETEPIAEVVPQSIPESPVAVAADEMLERIEHATQTVYALIDKNKSGVGANIRLKHGSSPTSELYGDWFVDRAGARMVAESRGWVIVTSWAKARELECAA